VLALGEKSLAEEIAMRMFEPSIRVNAAADVTESSRERFASNLELKK
jgi:hypothetical protein